MVNVNVMNNSLELIAQKNHVLLIAMEMDFVNSELATVRMDF
jgi:hypothetical protein